MMKKFFLCVSLVFLTMLPLFSEDEEMEVTTITISNARETNYKKNEETGNDTIVLKGSVELSVTKGTTTSEIKADSITYDRKTEMLYAEGNVEIETKTSSSGGEKTTASSLLLNTSTLEGVFDDGRVVQTQSDALNLPSGSTLIVFSDIFGKGSDNVISFKDSSLTFCDDEDPHWHIDASRTWLLPGGEFAFFNALLYVGSIPVLYFPAFYYPKDEIIFNPVFSYRKREGYSVQTTVYAYGRKPLNSSSSSSSSSSSTDTSTSAESLKALYNFMKPTSLKQQKLEGIVLHNLDEDYTGNTSNYLKVMGDWYSNLGLMAGLDGNFQPSSTYLTKLAFNAYMGFSNTIFLDSTSGEYFPFSSTGQIYEDSSTFLGLTLPFRYGAGLELTLSKPFRLSLSIPIYSDPFFAYDFKNNRSEYMDWISYLLDNSSKDDEEVTITEVSSLTWQLSSSYSPSIPSILTPYISSLSASVNSSVNISSMSTTFSYKDSSSGETLYNYDSENIESSWTSYTPSRKFYYPSLVTPATVSLSMSGTLFSWPLKAKSKASVSYISTLQKPDELKTEAELEEDRKKAEELAKKEAQEAGEEDKKEAPEEKKEDKKEKEAEEDKLNLTIPTLDFSATKESLADGLAYSLTYSAALNYASQVAYASSHLKTSNDFDWNDYRSVMYTLKTPLSLSSNLNYGGSFFSVVNKLAYSPVYQKHPYISLDEDIGGYTASAAKTLMLADYKAESQDIVNTNTITLKPLTYFDYFSNSSVSWNSTIKLYRTEFTGDTDTPTWKAYGVDWEDDDSITVNSLSAVLSSSEFDNKLTQSLSFTTVMPPLLRQYTASLNLTFPFVSASVSSGYQETTHDDVDAEEKWKKSPLSQSLTFTFPLSNINKAYTSSVKLSEAFTYNLEDDNPDSLKLTASWASFQLSYVMSYTYGYDFSKESGWTVRTDKEFLPYSLSASYSPSTKTFYKWSNRISVSPGLSTSVTADLLRPTNSYFLFSPSITFKIAEFLDLTFSSTSRNSVLYWYFNNNSGDFYSDWGGFPGNIVKDLIDSFRFDDNSKRENSGFKLKSLNMKISHDLHDWAFNFTMKVEPRLVTENGVKRYDFNPYITIGVVWNPMESMKTSIKDAYGEWSLE